jgi:hypothetical protein
MMHAQKINGRTILSRRVINLDTATLDTAEARENDKRQARARGYGFEQRDRRHHGRQTTAYRTYA